MAYILPEFNQTEEDRRKLKAEIQQANKEFQDEWDKEVIIRRDKYWEEFKQFKKKQGESIPDRINFGYLNDIKSESEGRAIRGLTREAKLEGYKDWKNNKKIYDEFYDYWVKKNRERNKKLPPEQLKKELDFGGVSLNPSATIDSQH